MRRSVFLSCLIFGVLLSVCSSFSLASTREEVLSRYEKLMLLLERSDLRGDYSGDASERMGSIHEALTRTDYDTAGRQIDSLAADLEKDQGLPKNDLDKESRLYWFEFLLDIFQKLAVLGLLAFLLIQNARWRMALKMNKAPNSTRFVWGFLAVCVSVAFRVLDLSRYGDSVWAIFDMQVVLAAVAGFLTGPLWGFLAGFLMALLRLLSKPGVLEGPAVVLSAAVIGGFFARGVDPYTRSGKRGFVCGALVGLAHGCIVYLPLAGVLPTGNIVFSIGLVTLLEALGVAVFFAVISAVLRSELKKDMENELLKTRLLFLQAQLRPHFFFNALNTISTICVRENASRAQGLILKLADFLRHTLKRENETATLREEISFIEDYLEIEKARFQDRLQVTTGYKIQESTWRARIPLLILQPLVENAIRHGIQKKPEGGYIRIHAEDAAGALKVEIEDNGVGADPMFFERMLRGEKTQVGGLGIGVRNIHERLKRTFGNEASLTFKTALGEGTRATVVIPLNMEKTT